MENELRIPVSSPKLNGLTPPTFSDEVKTQALHGHWERALFAMSFVGSLHTQYNSGSYVY